MLDAALRLIALGLAPHWLEEPISGDERSGKSPVVKGWQTQAAPTAAQMAARYEPGLNLGIHCGHVEGARYSLVGIDLDSAESVEWARGHFPATPIRTATSRGEHWYYRHPGQGIRVRGVKIPGRQSDHVRGDGGNLVCAPSVHWTGASYREIEPWTPEALAAMPLWDVRWAPEPVVTPIRPVVSRTSASPQRVAAWTRTALDNVEQELRSARPGERNNVVNGSAFRLGRLVGGGFISRQQAEDVISAAARSVGLRGDEFWKTIRSGLDSGIRQPHPGPASEVPPQLYIAAGVLRHGAAALATVRPEIRPTDFSDPHARQVVSLALEMPDAGPDTLLAEAPNVPEDWAALGELTTVEGIAERAAKLVQERPPELPEAYFLEDLSIPRYPVQVIDQSQAGAPAAARDPDPITSGSHVALADIVVQRIAAATGVDPVFTEGKLWAYNGGRGIWEEYTRLELQVQELDGEAWGTRAGRNGTTGPAGVISLRRSDVDGIIKCVHMALKEDRYFQAANPGIAFRNCFVQVTHRGVRIMGNNPGNRARFAYDFDYSPDWNAPRFARFLGELFAPDRDSAGRKQFLLEFIGASLIGVATTYQKAVVFAGLPGCGKSVLFDVLKSIFPPGSVVAVLPEELHLQWEKVRLMGAKLNACDELNGFTIQAVGTLKAAITGNVIQGRMVGEQGMDLVPVAGHLYSFNRAPRFNDISGGLEDRLVVIRFSRRFRGTPGDNKHLAREIIDAERPAIVAAAIEGAVRLLAQGRYTEVPSSAEALSEWSENNNPILLFARERLEKTAGLSTRWGDLYSAYTQWSQASGYRHPMTSHALKSALQIAGFTVAQGWVSARVLERS